VESPTTTKGWGVSQAKNQQEWQCTVNGLACQKIEPIHGPIPNNICTLGLTLNRECHLKTYTRTLGLYSYIDLQNENMLLLLIACETKTDSEKGANICFHHDKLSTKYNLQKNVFNPLNKP
jgi:hypothetical protein